MFLIDRYVNTVSLMQWKMMSSSHGCHRRPDRVKEIGMGVHTVRAVPYKLKDNGQCP
jgi:hypothetical protein